MSSTTNSKTERQRRRIFIVEDHPVTREGFAQLINFQTDLAVCGEASSAREALEQIPRARPDLAIVDITLEDGSGIELIKDLAAKLPGLPMLVLSMHDEKIYAERALRAGARGYIMKQTPTEKVLQGIRDVLAGQYCVSESVNERMLGQVRGRRHKHVQGVEGLSDRELEVFRLIGAGQSTPKIASELRVGVSTVETYRAHIKQKLGLENALDLVRAAVRWTENNP